MVILLYLFKLGIPLPKHSTELYHHFICSTICRHLAKLGNPLTHNITDLIDLPEPYSTIIKQLSKLSLEALNNNKLMFTLDDSTAACPDVAAVPGAINGFGLLQAVQHFNLYAKTVTLAFIHFTIHEFLAAHYISHLPPNKELEVIEANFWSDVHFNMFSTYISLTKGQRPAFKLFLSGGNMAINISHKFLKNQLKSLRLYHCFSEADDQAMCNAIQQADIFHDKVIHLAGITLTASDMECVTQFLTSSFKEWVRLNLNICYIQDRGLNIVYRGLRHSSVVTINELYLVNNGLTTQSSSVISELTVKCNVKVLAVSYNHTVGEDEQLYSMLTDPSNRLEKLYMEYINLSSKAAVALFTALKDNDKLKKLNVNDNDITDEAFDVIITALEENSCLVKLHMFSNTLSSQTILNIVRCLEVNNTLQLLKLPKCPQDIQENVKFMLEAINKTRENQGCQVKLEIEFSNF